MESLTTCFSPNSNTNYNCYTFPSDKSNVQNGKDATELKKLNFKHLETKRFTVTEGQMKG